MLITTSDLVLAIIVIISLVAGVLVARKAKSLPGFIMWCFSWYVGACYIAGVAFILLGDAPHGLPMNWLAFIVSPVMPFWFLKFLSSGTEMTKDFFVFYAIFPVIYVSGLWWYSSKKTTSLTHHSSGTPNGAP